MSMSLIRRIALMALAATPIPTVAFAAQSKLTELENQDAYDRETKTSGDGIAPTTADLRDPEVVRARDQLLPRMTVKMSLAASFDRFRELNPGLSGAVAADEFGRLVDLLRGRGLLTITDKEVISKSASGV